MIAPRSAALALAALGLFVPRDVPGQSGTGDDLTGFAARSWTTEDGLPINQVVDLRQTPDGYLWLATFGGLVRFDGNDFRVYDAADYPTLSSSRFQAIEVAPDGAIIAQSEFGHVARFSDGRFSVLVPGPGLSGDRSTGLWKASDGTVWIGTNEDAGFIDGDSVVSAFPRAPGWPIRVATRALGRLWVGTRDGQLHVIGPEGRRTISPLLSDSTSFWSQISGIQQGADGAIYVGTLAGLHRLDPESFEMRKLHDISVSCLMKSPDGERIVAAGDHVLEVGEDGRVTTLATGRGQGTPSAVHWDRAGRLWYAHGSTVYREGTRVHEAESWVETLFEDAEGSMWIGGAGGLTQLSRAAFTTLAPPEGARARGCMDSRNCPPGFGVYSIMEDPQGRGLWIGTLHYGTWRLDASGSFEQVDETATIALGEDAEGVLRGGYRTGLCRMRPGACVPVAGVTGDVRAIARGRNGALWVGADGLYRIEDGQVTRFGALEGLPDDGVFAVRVAPDGATWVGTLRGLVRIHEGSLEVLDERGGLSSSTIRSLMVDTLGVAWVGTESRGLNRVELVGDGLEGARITRYRASDGLYSDGIHTVVDDGYGRLWMSSNQGIFWVRRDELEGFARGDVARLHSVSYTESDGLANREANGGSTSSSLRASDGRLWFATMGGAAVVDPGTISSDRPPPNIVVESVTAGDATIEPDTLVVLPRGERDFEISYTAPTFTGVRNLRFRYRLEGFDRDWVEIGPRRSAIYTNVPPGHHRFRVAVAAEGARWSEAGALSIQVPSFFYEEGWFAALLGLLAVTLLAALLRWREVRHRSHARRLEALVAERTTELELEKEESERARRSAEQAESMTREALAKVEAQAERLEQLDRTRSRFFANISHELRTPLSLTIGPLEDLRDGLHGNVEEEAREDVDLALRNARRLLRLVSQMLDLSKAEAGQLELRPAEVDLAKQVRSVAEAFRPLCDRQNIALKCEGLDNPVPAVIDAEQFEKVILNLLSNAVKFTPSGGAVSVTLAIEEGDAESSRALLTVRDTGRGIPEEVQAHVFDRFYQGEVGADLAGTGTGIGLSLAREIVEVHRGRIRVESAPPEGSSFIVEMPLGALDVAAPGSSAPKREKVLTEEVMAPLSETENDAEHPASDDPRTTILVVDDDDDLRMYVRRHLAPRYRVLEAPDGNAGFELARTHTPDLVLSDVRMPGLDGWQLCAAIKADPEMEFIPVILLTGRASRESRVQGFEAGADDYLTKPFSMQELEARIATLSEARQRLRDRVRKMSIVSAGAPADASSADERFLENVRRIILDRLDDEDFGVEELADRLGYSRAHLYRRLGELQDRSPAQLIRLMRLDRAAELLDVRAGTVSEIAYAVGFKSVSHFSHSFRNRYGVSPSAYSSREHVTT